VLLPSIASVSYRMFLVEDDPGLVRAVADLIAGRGYLVNDAFKNDGVPNSTFRFGNVRVNFRKSEITRDGGRVALSERESRLLRFLLINRGTTVSRDTLLEYVWGYRSAPLTRTVDVTILRLRQKIESDPRNPRHIITVPGLGYRFER
jgi:DNA-binding response OmpR family regulator